MDKAEIKQYISGKSKIEVTRCFCGEEPIKALIKSCLRERINNKNCIKTSATPDDEEIR